MKRRMVSAAILLLLAFPIHGFVVGGDVGSGFSHARWVYGAFAALTLAGAYLALRQPPLVSVPVNLVLVAAGFGIFFFAPWTALAPLLLVVAALMGPRGGRTGTPESGIS